MAGGWDWLIQRQGWQEDGTRKLECKVVVVLVVVLRMFTVPIGLTQWEELPRVGFWTI